MAANQILRSLSKFNNHFRLWLVLSKCHYHLDSILNILFDINLQGQRMTSLFQILYDLFSAVTNFRECFLGVISVKK